MESGKGRVENGKEKNHRIEHYRCCARLDAAAQQSENFAEQNSRQESENPGKDFRFPIFGSLFSQPFLLSGQTHYNRFYIENGAKERNGLRKHSFCAAARAANVYSYKHKTRVAC